MENQENRQFDVIVIGGGVNGCGTARDLAMRGIKTLLLEKGDFSAGTSGSSSGMIHGGPRYIFTDVQTTKLSCLDSGYIQKVAPHLLFRIPFLYTVYQEEGQSLNQAKLHLELVEAFFEGYDRFVPLKNGKPHSRLTVDEVMKLEPGMVKDKMVGAITFDEWGIDVARLCVANAMSAEFHGATIKNYHQVTEVLKEKGRVVGVRVKDLINNKIEDYKAKIVFNATGPWSPEFGKLAGVPIQLRPGKGIHITFDRRLCNVAINCKTIDGRETFLMPYENVSYLGTTDDDYFADLDNQEIFQEEVRYLIEGVARVFPSVKDARMIRAWSGVRPTLYGRNCYEDDLSREHELYDHETRDNLPGLVSMIGGKLASYRVMSQEAADLIAKKLGNTNPSQTHAEALPGGDSLPSVKELSKEYDVDPYAVSRLIYRHGSLAKKILATTKEDKELKNMICSCEPVLAAEVKYVVENEWVKCLSDLRRRTRFSLGPCQATHCLTKAGQSLVSESVFPPNDFDQSINHFMEKWWNGKSVVLGGDQLAQEEMNQALHYGTYRYHRAS